MKRKLGLLLVGLLLSAVLASCAGGQPAAPAVADSAPAEEEEIEAVEDPAGEESALLVGEMDFTLSQLEAMNTLDVEYTGKDDSVTTYTGIQVLDLIAEAGLVGDTVVLIASDGYEAELSIADLESCLDCVVAFDGDELRTVLPGFSSKVQVKGLVEIQAK